MDMGASAAGAGVVAIESPAKNGVLALIGNVVQKYLQVRKAVINDCAAS